MGLKESGLRGSLRNVSVGIDAIPDNQDYWWPIDEGEGETITDAKNDVVADFVGSPTWESADVFGGQQIILDGETDGWETGSINNLSGTEFNISRWIELSEIIEGDRQPLFALGDGIQGNYDLSGDGICVYIHDDNRIYANLQDDGSIANEAGASFDASGLDNELLFASVNADTENDILDFYLYDKDTQIAKEEDANSDGRAFGELSEPNFISEHETGAWEAIPDRKDIAAGIAESRLTESQIEDIWQSTA